MERSAIEITATLDKPDLLNDIVEKLAQQRFDIGHILENVQAGWNLINTSSVEAYANGNINISTETDLISMPFNNCFIFTCIKDIVGNTTVEWSISLS